MNPKTKLKQLKTHPCCKVVEAKDLKFPAVFVGSIAENRSEFEAKLAWCFEFRATFRDGSQRFMAWKVMGLAEDKAAVYERLRRRADGEGIVLIEVCSVSPAMTEEQVEEIRKINHELTRMDTKKKI